MCRYKNIDIMPVYGHYGIENRLILLASCYISGTHCQFSFSQLSMENPYYLQIDDDARVRKVDKHVLYPE